MYLTCRYPTRCLLLPCKLSGGPFPYSPVYHRCFFLFFFQLPGDNKVNRRHKRDATSLTAPLMHPGLDCVSYQFCRVHSLLPHRFGSHGLQGQSTHAPSVDRDRVKSPVQPLYCGVEHPRHISTLWLLPCKRSREKHRAYLRKPLVAAVARESSVEFSASPVSRHHVRPRTHPS